MRKLLLVLLGLVIFCQDIFCQVSDASLYTKVDNISTYQVSVMRSMLDSLIKSKASLLKFNASDFNVSASGAITIDYTNGQAASGSTKGFLTSADWTTFNNKASTAYADAKVSQTITDGVTTSAPSQDAVRDALDALPGATVASFAEALAGTNNTKTMTPLRVRSVAGRVYNVEAYGAVHDYQTVSNASITSGTASLTTATAAFTSADVGKTIRLFGAGAAGADLITTISAFVSSTAVTIGTNASTTITTKQIEWATDDTAAIQSAIIACFTVGGGIVYFPLGVYYIAGSLVTSLNGVNPNCQLYIPLTNTYRAGTLPSIVLRGEGETEITSTGLVTATTGVTGRGVVLKSPIVGSGTLPSVIAQPYFNNGFTDTNYTKVTFENITVQVKSMTGTTHVPPTMSAFMLRHSLAASALGTVTAFTESNIFDGVEPTGTTYGFYFPLHASAQSDGRIDQITAYGFNVGVYMEEHNVFNRVFSAGCVYGLRVGGLSASHPSGFGVYLGHWNRYNLDLVNGGFIFLDMYLEDYTGIFGAKWYNITADVLVTNGAFDGEVRAVRHDSGGTNTVISVSGTITGLINIIDYNLGFTYSQITGNYKTTIGVSAGHYIQNNSTTGQTALYLDNNRGSFASYGGLLNGGSSNAAGNLFGVSRVDKVFLFADGASNLGLYTGTLNAQPYIFGTNNAERARIISSGEFGVGVTSPTTKLHTTAFATAYVAKTGAYTLTASDYTVEVTSGTHTQTLPTAVGITGRIYAITNSGSGTVTIGTTSSQTFANVSGTPTTLTVTQFQTKQVQSNGSNWLLIASF